MGGTTEGGLKSRATNYKKYGKDFYREIGRKGGKNGHTGGFAANPALARIAGAKGGRISKRGPSKKNKANKTKKTTESSAAIQELLKARIEELELLRDSALFLQRRRIQKEIDRIKEKLKGIKCSQTNC